jgi:prevent-host-death family protein
MYHLMVKTVQIQELKRSLSQFVDEAETGARILVTRHGRPVAALVPPPGEGVHVGARYGRARLAPLAGVAVSMPIAGTLAEDRAEDR